MSARVLRRSQLHPAGLAAFAALFAAGAIAATGIHNEPATTYGGTSVGLRMLDLAAGFALLAAGLGASWSRSMRRPGLLTLLIAVAWFAPDLDGWVSGPAVLRSLGAPAMPFLIPLVLDLVLTYGWRKRRTGRERVALGCLYAVTALASLMIALLRDPLLDIYCWRNCNVNAFLLHPESQLVRALADAWPWIASAIGCVVVVTCVVRLVKATRAAQRLLAPVLLPASLAGAATVCYEVALIRAPLEGPTRNAFVALFAVRAAAFIALAAGIAWGTARLLRARARVTNLAADLARAPAPGRLAAELAVALGDSSIEVLYPVADHFVDADGVRRTPPTPDRGRAVTQVARGDRAIALVVHDAALLDGHDLEDEIGSAARLVAENEALQAEALARMHDLRASRARVVARSDEARRRLERDLHDGAQQRLVAVLFDLERAETAAGSVASGSTVLIASATSHVEAGFNALRELVQGIYPLVLTDAGLEAALLTLADSTPIPLDLSCLPDARFAEDIEIGVYVAVAEAVRDAVSRGATFARAEIYENGDRLVVTISDDGVHRGRALLHVADRVGALGGSLTVSPSHLRAEIPCA